MRGGPEPRRRPTRGPRDGGRRRGCLFWAWLWWTRSALRLGVQLTLHREGQREAGVPPTCRGPWGRRPFTPSSSAGRRGSSTTPVTAASASPDGANTAGLTARQPVWESARRCRNDGGIWRQLGGQWWGPPNRSLSLCGRAGEPDKGRKVGSTNKAHRPRSRPGAGIQSSARDDERGRQTGAGGL